jgi:hypothetical protein
MWKNISLLALVACTVLVSTNALKDMKNRLKNRVIHIESLFKRGRWLWQNDHSDKDGAKYLWVDALAERDTYYTPRVQFTVKYCSLKL